MLQAASYTTDAFFPRTILFHLYFILYYVVDIVLLLSFYIICVYFFIFTYFIFLYCFCSVLSFVLVRHFFRVFACIFRVI